MNAQFIEFPGDLQLVFNRKRNARLLRPIPQSGIVDFNLLHWISPPFAMPELYHQPPRFAARLNSERGMRASSNRVCPIGWIGNGIHEKQGAVPASRESGCSPKPHRL